MIELRQVTKKYGPLEALHEVSFTAPRGQITGLLGVNGAGKTTALNILTGYFPPTAGQVLVDGMDMLTDSARCKRQIGFLPEKPPIYDEMTVREYLTFASRLREVEARSIPAHVREIIGLCGLEEAADRTLGRLSKGYRQRVGFAQALCGAPPVLVLDEPTVGLDPRQVAEIRELMRRLGEKHTIIFSSHLLSEVQQLCSRVVILHHGRVLREANLGDMMEDGGTLRLRVSIALGESRLLPALRSLPCVRRVKTLPTQDAAVTEAVLECDAAQDPQTQLFHLLAAMDAPLRLLYPERDSLEDVFLRATEEG